MVPCAIIKSAFPADFHSLVCYVERVDNFSVTQEQRNKIVLATI